MTVLGNIDELALASEIEQLIAAHFAGPRMRAELEIWRHDFQTYGFCKFARLVPESVKLLVYHDIAHSLDRAGRRRDLAIRVTDYSPRVYLSVDCADVFEHSVTIPILYRSPAFLRFLAELTDEPEVIPVPYAPEEVVINCMQRPRDEHGWHWDDYRYSLVWMVKPARRGNGGEIQIVRDTVWNKADPQIARYLRTRPIESHYIEEGTAYFIRGDTTMHRVSPLVEDDVRIISCFSYAGADELHRVVSHETMEELYPSAVPVEA
jgi:hypothetical protein